MSKLDKAIEQVLFENNIPNEWSSEINNELDQLKSETMILYFSQLLPPSNSPLPR